MNLFNKIEKSGEEFLESAQTLFKECATLAKNAETMAKEDVISLEQEISDLNMKKAIKVELQAKAQKFSAKLEAFIDG